ncbi:MAG: DUF4214 domain-containing protein [Alphaproteobacteria bacterium]
MPTPSENITRIYAGYFNRAPDPEGLNYWVSRLNGGMSLLDVAQSFSVQPEATALYGFLTSPGSGSPSSFLDSIYRNLFNRAIDGEGLGYWTGQLNAGKPVGRAIIDIISGAQGNDLLVENNKVAVGQHFISELQRLNLSFGLDAARNAYTGVSHLGASLTTALSALNNMLTSLPSAAGNTFALTTGIDNLTGSDHNDIFNAMVDSDSGSGQTLTAADTINGGGGIDTLNILFNPAGTVSFPTANISNVEVINLRNISRKALTFDSAMVADDMVVNADRSTNAGVNESDITIINLPEGASVGVISDGVMHNGGVNIGYAQTGGTGIVTLSGVAGGTFGSGRVTFTSEPISVIVNTSSLPNRIEQLEVGNAAKTLTINANSSLYLQYGINSSSALETIIVTGSGHVRLGFPQATIIDASAMTAGGIDVFPDEGITSLIGGQGDDYIGILGPLNNGNLSVINAGGGAADSLILSDTAIDDSAQALRFRNFEILEVFSSVVNASLFTNSSIHTIHVNGNSVINGLNTTQTPITEILVNGDVTLNELSSFQAAHIYIGGLGGSSTFNINNATAPGQIDVLNLAVISDPLLSATYLSDIIAPGVEIINFSAGGNLFVISMAGATALTNSTITGTGNVRITTGTLALNPGSMFDASAVSGNVRIDASTARSNGAMLLGSATKDSMLIGTDQSDTIIAGNSIDRLGIFFNDYIDGGKGADILTSGLGRDRLVFDARNGATTSGDLITDFVVGTDKLEFLYTGEIASSQQAIVQSSVSALSPSSSAAQIAMTMAASNATNNAVSFAVFGGDTYVYYERTGSSGGVAANDVFIKLAGVSSGFTFAGGLAP